MTVRSPGLVLSEVDQASIVRVEAIERGGAGGIDALTALLVDKSWEVRRAVVGALARLGDPAVGPLCDVLVTRRDGEGRLAATVDALVASRGDVESALLGMVESETAPAVLCDLIQVLGRRRADVAAPVLGRLSGHADDNVATAALEALGRLSVSASIDPLIAAVESRKFFRTFPAIAALAKTCHPRAVQPLTGLLADPYYAAEAVHALGAMGQVSAAASVARLLASTDVVMVRLAAQALVELATTVDSRAGTGGAVRQVVSGSARPEMPTSVVAAMTGATDAEQGALITALAFVGDAHVAALLEGAHHEKRLRLLAALARPRAYVKAVAACLTDRDPAVRALACDVLARAGEPTATPALFDLLGDADAHVAQCAVGAIQSLGSDETRRLALAAAASVDARARRNALRILAYFGYPEGLDLLVAAMGDDDPRIRDAAIHGLAFVEDGRALPALIEASQHASPKTRAAVMRALGQTSASTADGVLRAGLRDGDPWVRYYACQSLAKLGVTSAEDEVIALLDDPAGQVRLAAVEGLARFPGDRPRVVLEGLASSSDPDMRRAAIVGLGLLGRDEVLPLLRSAAAATDPATRLVAIAALAELGHPDVVDALAAAAGDADESVQRAALALLARRPGRAATEAILQLFEQPRLRSAVVDALGTFVDGRVEAILAALEVADANRAPLLVAALERFHRNAASALVAVLDIDNPHARRAVVRALATMGTSDALAALERAASSDPDADVRRMAIESRS